MLWLAGVMALAEPAPVKVEATLDAARPGREIPKSFAGFSREWRRFPFAQDGKADVVHPKYLQLLRNLCAFNDEALSIRIGGASADGMKEPPDDDRWKQIAQVYEATQTPLILTLNLAKGDAELCREWIRRAKTHLPEKAIRGFELGNEPDGWFGRHRPKDYKWETYFDEFAAMRAALVPAEVKSVIGPAWAHGLPPDIAEVMLKKNPGAISMLTGHAYSFSPQVGVHPEKILIDSGIQKTIDFLSPGIKAAHDAGLPFRLDEAGSAWGGGVAGFSDSFGASLWIIDFCLSLANAGLDGVNFHGGGKGHYSAIQDDSDDKKFITRSITPKATYYGLLLFAEAAAHHARFIPVTSEAVTHVKMWATLDAHGTRRVVIINKNLDRPAQLTIKAGDAKRATLKRLEAPSLAATDGIRFGGQTFDGSPDGRPLGEPKVESLTASDGSITFVQAAASAVLLMLDAK